MSKDTEITVYQGNLPSQVSRRVEVEFNQQMERIVAIGELGMVGMSAISEVERHAAFKVATTAAAAELLSRGAAATRPNGKVTVAEQEMQQALFEEYTHRVTQLAEITNIKVLQAIDRATEQLGRRTVADALERFDALLADAVRGRSNPPSSLPNGRR